VATCMGRIMLDRFPYRALPGGARLARRSIGRDGVLPNMRVILDFV
jgi:hypothetical protein